MGEVQEQLKGVVHTCTSVHECSEVEDQPHELWPGLTRHEKGNQMNFRKTLLSSFAAAGLVLSMAGVGLAQDNADVPVNYGCETTAGSVSVDVLGEIDYGLGDFSGGGAVVEVTLDLTCNFSSNFSVSAAIGDFSLQGPGSGNPVMATGFGGEHFRMDNGQVTSIDFVEVPGFTSAPAVQETVFAGLVTEEDAIVVDDDSTTWVQPIPWLPIYVPIIGIWQASPGVSVIEWDASVHYLPINLTPGTYTAPLVVDLTVN